MFKKFVISVKSQMMIPLQIC